MKKIKSLKELKDISFEIYGVATGTNLDNMFYRITLKNGKPIKESLGGIPAGGVLNITGIPDTGKSLLVEQFVIVQASLGEKVLFVTTETPSPFLYESIKTRAKAMGKNFEKIEKNIFVIDVTQDAELRENPKTLINTMKYGIEEKGIKCTVIDSITGLYEHKEMMARSIVRIFYNFLKSKRQTALIVSQKRSSQASESAEAAGGLAVAHIVDGTIVMDKKLIENRWDSSLYKLSIGKVLRTIRIDGCRIAPHSTETWIFNITDEGLIDIKMPLSEYLSGGKNNGDN